MGVDVFFAISGYLITAHAAARDRRAPAGVSLPAFWARRARRILPAALVDAAGSARSRRSIFVPISPTGSQFLAERRASTAVRPELAVAGAAVDYSAADNAPARSALLVAVGGGAVLPRLAGAARCGRPRRAPGHRRVRVGRLTGHLAYSLDSPPPTPRPPTSSLRPGPGSSVPAGCSRTLAGDRAAARGAAVSRLRAGWGRSPGRGGRLSRATPFPGRAAVPVLGALAVIAAGAPTGGARRARPTGPTARGHLVLGLPLALAAGDLRADRSRPRADHAGGGRRSSASSILLGWLTEGRRSRTRCAEGRS